MAAAALLMIAARLRIDPFLSGDLPFYACIALAAATRYRFRHARSGWRRGVGDYCEYAGLLMAICLLGALASYPAAAESHGFADARLQAIDHELRFSWIAWYDVVAAHPALQLIERIAYESIFVTPALILACFAATGRRAEARLFIVSVWIAAVMTLTLFAFMPAEGPLAFLWRGPIPYMPLSALYQAELIPSLRDHALNHVSLNGLHGLVCAPSFHAACAVLFIAAAAPVPRLRWIVAPVALAMLLATPVEGTHYFVDVIAGCVVALVAVAAATALQRVARQRGRTVARLPLASAAYR